MDEILKVNEGANLKQGYGKRTLAIVTGMINSLRADDRLPKTKDGNEYPVDLWVGVNKDGLDRASVTFNTGNAKLTYSLDEYSENNGIFVMTNKYTKGAKSVPLAQVETTLPDKLLKVVEAFHPDDINTKALYKVIGAIGRDGVNEQILKDDKEVSDVYAQLRTVKNGKREGEEYIAVCSHTSPDKVYNLNLNSAGQIDSIVAVDFSQKNEEGHPHTEFAPFSKAKDLIGKEENATLRNCLTSIVDNKERQKETER